MFQYGVLAGYSFVFLGQQACTKHFYKQMQAFHLYCSDILHVRPAKFDVGIAYNFSLFV